MSKHIVLDVPKTLDPKWWFGDVQRVLRAAAAGGSSVRMQFMADSARLVEAPPDAAPVVRTDVPLYGPGEAAALREEVERQSKAMCILDAQVGRWYDRAKQAEAELKAARDAWRDYQAAQESGLVDRLEAAFIELSEALKEAKP